MPDFFWIVTLLLSDRAYRDGVADGLKRGFDRLEVLDLAVVVPANLFQEVEARLALSVRGFGFSGLRVKGLGPGV